MKTVSKPPRKHSPVVEAEADLQHIPKEIIYYLPPGTCLSDIYIDAPQVALELKFGKRVISNMRRSGKLSYTTFNGSGKIFYYKQEIAGILERNKIMAKA